MALNCYQPWASLIAHGLLRVETRGIGRGSPHGGPFSKTWRPAWCRHRGPVLVYAAKTWDSRVRNLRRNEPHVVELVRRHFGHGPEALPRGCLVGRVDIAGCEPAEQVLASAYHGIPWGRCPGGLFVDAPQRALGDYSPGRFALPLANAVALADPVPYAGKAGFFSVPESEVPEELR